MALRPVLSRFALVIVALLASGSSLFATNAAVPNVPFLNGGITKDEADAMRREAPRYPLEVTLARRGETPGSNEFVADARLRVIDGSGRVLLERNDTGPIFLASLPDGAYTVEATYNGQAKSQRVQLRRAHHTQLTFLWE